MVRDLKFQIKKVEGLYYLCGENKGADQLCGYCAADLRLCFRIYAKRSSSHDADQMDLASFRGLAKASVPRVSEG